MRQLQAAPLRLLQTSEGVLEALTFMALQGLRATSEGLQAPAMMTKTARYTKIGLGMDGSRPPARRTANWDLPLMSLKMQVNKLCIQLHACASQQVTTRSKGCGIFLELMAYVPSVANDVAHCNAACKVHLEIKSPRPKHGPTSSSSCHHAIDLS